MLLQMEKDATNSRIIEAVLPCVGPRGGNRSSVALLACASDIEVRTDRVGLDLLHPLRMAQLNPRAFIAGTAEIKEDFNPGIPYGKTQLLMVYLSVDSLLHSHMHVW